MKHSRASNGFTIIELIVVMVVLAILSTIVIISYDGFQKKTRDSQRTSDIAQIKIALDKYYAEQSQYPAVCAGDNVACAATALATPLNQYIKTFPSDPLGGTRQYEYIRGGTSGNAYALKADYEQETDCKTGVRVDTNWWTAAVPVCD